MSAVNGPRALLFDLDGTLIDSDPLHAKVYVEMLAEHGITADDAFYQTHVHGRRNVEVFADLLPDEDAQALDREKEARFRAALGTEAAATPGLIEFLDAAGKAALPVALVTNACRENVDAMLSAIGLVGRFPVLALGDEMPRGKPFPDPYLKAAADLGFAPADCLAFEDSPTGIRSAAAAGVPVIGVRSSLDDAALRAAGAFVTIEDFTDPGLARTIPALTGAAV